MSKYIKTILNKPHFITDRDIDSWFEKVHSFITNELKIVIYSAFSGLVLDPNNEINSLVDNLTLEFSDENKKSPYNIQDINGVKRKILDKYSDIRGLKDWIVPIKEFNNNTLGSLADTISTHSGKDFESVLNDLKKIFYDTPMIKSRTGALILGEYYFEDNKIVLYTNSIKQMETPTKPLLNCFEEVFAHEFFHVVHYDLSLQENKELIYRDDYTSKVVKESLAAYFEYLFCNFNKIECDINLDWSSVNVTFYPYSGALEIKDLKQFNNVLAESSHDLDMALRKLFSNKINTFYEIKNLCKTITITKKDKPTIMTVGTILSSDFERLINSSGSGWLVLRLYGKYVSSSYREWDNPIDKCLTSRINAFKQIEPHELNIIKFLNHILYKAKTSVEYNAETRTIKLDELKKKAEEILKIL